ncbi:MAG: hypothetical protein OXH29_03850 [bacterium]|nr:hypothetical protein [bacterium]
MAERPSSETPFERMDPAQVSGQSFAIIRKGFDQMQVQAYLVSVGNQIKAGQQQIRDLREQVAQAERQSEPESEFSSQGVKLLDSGVEASRRQAQTEADEMAARARRLAEELQTTFEELRSHQEFSGAEELAELLEQAYEQAQAVAGLLQEARDQAEAEVEHGRAQGREIVEQAKALRITVLRDMARRRQGARAQVERLRAGRDKLISMLSEARSSIDQSMETARLSLAEAKVLADAAARRIEDEAEPTDLALLSELDDAQVVGMVPETNTVSEAEAQPEPVEASDSKPASGVEPVASVHEIQERVTIREGETDQEGVTLLPPVERDPVEAAADHPVLSSVEDERDVDAIFARLRSQSEGEQEEVDTGQDAAKSSVGKD